MRFSPGILQVISRKKSFQQQLPNCTPEVVMTGGFMMKFTRCCHSSWFLLGGILLEAIPHGESRRRIRVRASGGGSRFSFKESKKAIHERALIGKGGAGSVYEGTLTPSGVEVAVERLSHAAEHLERDSG